MLFPKPHGMIAHEEASSIGSGDRQELGPPILSSSAKGGGQAIPLHRHERFVTSLTAGLSKFRAGWFATLELADGAGRRAPSV